MCILRKVELGDDILITLKLTKDEYGTIGPDAKEFAILPADGLKNVLTTGRLGHGNRIMIPNKFLKKYNINFLKKKVKSTIVDMMGKKFLVIELEDKNSGIPVFGGDYGEREERIERA